MVPSVSFVFINSRYRQHAFPVTVLSLLLLLLLLFYWEWEVVLMQNVPLPPLCFHRPVLLLTSLE